MSAPDDDDDPERTVVRPRSQRSAMAPLGHTLPVGTHLRDYEINGLIGEGGFGIVYLAWDHSLQRKVAIKEYMPASMASRVAGSSAIVVKSERHLDTFKAGLRSFVNEARLLARFDHPSLVKVYRFWEENGTAYMAMPFYEGPTLKTALAELGHVPDEAELRAWLNPLLDALAVMHAAQCFHRDIAPDNILLTAAGPLLLDFGAARRVIGDMTHALTVVLKPGYAPIEQYGDVASMSQGAWTDLYALACVVYYAITGKTPMSSVERLMDDRLEPLAVAAAGRYGDGFLRAIDAALAVRPVDRPQNEAQFRALLNAGLPPSVTEARSSGYGTLSHEAFPSTEQPYSTVPGTLTPVLATEWQPRPTERVEPPSQAPASAPESIHPQDMAASGATIDARPGAGSDIEPGAGLGEIAAASPPLPAASPDAARDTAPFVAPSMATRVPQPARETRVRGAAVAAGFVIVALALGAAVYWFAQPGAPSGASPAASGAALAASAVVAPPGTVPPPVATSPPVAEPAPAAATPSSPAASPAQTTPIGASPAEPATAPNPAPPVASSAAVEAPTRARRPDAAPAETVRSTPPKAEPTLPSPVERPRSKAPPPRIETPAEATPAAPRRPTTGTRCSDILQKASLEPLTAEEAAYLKRECR